MSYRKGKPLRETDPHDRPREKLLRYGPEKLSTSELLAILIGLGNKKNNVLDLGNKLHKTFGSSSTLASITKEELLSQSGIGVAAACRILASIEIGKRLYTAKEHNLILTPLDVWQQMKDIRGHRKEHVVVFFLDSRNQTIEREIISIGTVDKTVVHPREVFESAIKHTASHIILAHNHPTGNTEPSEYDMILTRRIVSAGEILGIDVLDHIIVTQRNYMSMKEQGLL